MTTRNLLPSERVDEPAVVESLKSRLDQGATTSTNDVRGVALAISRIPYGRPREPTADGVLTDWRGTCSTKHALFAAIVAEVWPTHQPRLWHRPYLVTRGLVEARWGTEVAAVVPECGLVDVHTFATVDIAESPVQVDVTFPLSDWDGRTHVPLACGPGEDIPARDDPLASKAQLVAQHCEPAVREPFIAALARVHTGM